MEISSHVPSNRFEEDDDALLLSCQAHGLPQHQHGVDAVRRTGDHKARNVAKHCDRVVVVEVATEAALVSEASNADHHGVGELPIRKERQRCCLTAELVLGIVQIREELDLDDWDEPVVRQADAHAKNRLLVEDGVDHPMGAEPLLEPLGHAVHATLGPDIFARKDDLAVPQQLVGQRPVQQLCQMLRFAHQAHLVRAEHFGPIFDVQHRGGLGYPPGRDNAGHHLVGRLEPLCTGHGVHRPIDLGADTPVTIEHIGRRQIAELSE